MERLRVAVIVRTESLAVVELMGLKLMRAVFGGLLGGMVLLAVSAVAEQHPVPLDSNVTAAKCIECHENKAKGKAVHTVTEKGCLSCHEVRVTKDITRVKLITATPLKLCLQCHTNKDANQVKGHMHSPAIRDCLKCHDPHTSNNKFELLRSTSGSDKSDNLCLTCHTTGLNPPKDGSRHAALDLGCDTCHVTHKTGDKSNDEFGYHLTKSSPALCIECHDVNDAGLLKSHEGQPFGKSDCVTCHDPHQSSRPKLMQAFVHPPFGEKLCDVCHEPSKNGKVVLTQASVKELCVGCHAEQAEKIDKSKFQHPGAQGDCTDCHNPHAGRAPGFPKPNPVTVCLNCHVDQEQLQTKRVLHQPVFEQGCTTCHDPHGAEHPKLLRAEGNALCTECHSSTATHGEVQDAHLMTIFGGKVRLPEDYFKETRIVRFNFDNGTGHPVGRHPVTDVHDPADPMKVKWPLNCLSCHQPHAGAARAMLVKDQAPGSQFCRNCHDQNIGAE